jgi:NitT/TauT family transport system substrate-binding protein
MKAMPIGRSAQRLGGGRVRIAVGCAVAALLLAGCSSFGGSSASGTAPAGASITVAAVPGVGDAPLYVAWQKGLFRQHGLTVHLRSYQTMTQVMAALHSGQANVAVGDYADFFYEQERDASAPMVVLADGYDAAPNIMDVLVRPDSTITAPLGLKGARIGTAEPQVMPDNSDSVAAPYSIETVAASSALDNDGVQPNLVHWVPMQAKNLVPALSNHQVDAILVTEPQIFQAESEIGARTILDACSGETVNLPLDGYFAPRSFAEKNRAALLTFRSVLTRAQADAVQPAPVQAVLRHYAGMSRETASLITVGQYPTALKVTSLQRVADLMSFYGALSQPLVVSHMLFP